MSGTYTTRQGETVDLICHRHYGRARAVTEIVLAANAGLAALGPVLPMGIVIALPDVTEQLRRRPLTSLWD